MSARRTFVVAALITLFGCAADPVLGPTTPSTLVLVSGDAQQGTPGYRLPNEVVVRLLDEHGAGVVGAEITFRSDDPYTLPEPATAVTDSTGVARTWWRLGSTLGAQELVATHDLLPSVRLHASASSGDPRNVTGAIGGVLCLLDQVGALSCGRAPEYGKPNPPPRVAAPGGLRFSEVVVASPTEGCAVAESGRVWCFVVPKTGDVTFAAFQELPGSYPPLHGLNAPTFGERAYCALSESGQGYCWGANLDLRLALPVGVNPASPTAINTAQPFSSIVVGRQSGCGLATGGVAWCWGSNVEGVNGQPITFPNIYSTPAPLTTALRFSKLMIGNGFATACGITTTQEFWCWGYGFPDLDPLWVRSGPVPQKVPTFDGLLDANIAYAHLTSLHRANTTPRTISEPFLPGSVVFRASDFGWNPVRTFLNGPTLDVVCGSIVGGGGVLCRSIARQELPLAYALSHPGVEILGIPPQ